MHIGTILYIVKRSVHFISVTNLASHVMIPLSLVPKTSLLVCYNTLLQSVHSVTRMSSAILCNMRCRFVPNWLIMVIFTE